MKPGVPDDAYGNQVIFTTNGTTDTYTVNGTNVYNFLAGTAQSQVYLTIAIKENLLLFMSSLQAFVQSYFSVQVQLQLVCMYLGAQEAGLTNRATYIAQVLTWLNGIETYAATYVSSVQAMMSTATIISTAFDSTQISAAPSVTLIGAISIQN